MLLIKLAGSYAFASTSSDIPIAIIPLCQMQQPRQHHGRKGDSIIKACVFGCDEVSGRVSTDKVRGHWVWRSWNSTRAHLDAASRWDTNRSLTTVQPPTRRRKSGRLGSLQWHGPQEDVRSAGLKTRQEVNGSRPGSHFRYFDTLATQAGSHLYVEVERVVSDKRGGAFCLFWDHIATDTHRRCQAPIRVFS